MIEMVSKQKQKTKIIIGIGIIFSFLGISIISIPFPNSFVIENLGQFGIAEGVTYSVHYKYPTFSTNQKMIMSLGAVNSSFTILVLNDKDHRDWIDEQEGYLPIYGEQNIDGVYKILYLNQHYIGYIHILITAETSLELYGTIQTSYSSHYVIQGLMSLIAGIISLMILVSQKYRNKNMR
ncbi:hypothetical protein LCGC14_1430680 [marine sediment metagenome]|uniref:Uncharacterized protein n=1 Tax=marine sediment metagenome TaxID=412755 RepID=A0A0F9JNP7_9ZZZZ